MHGPSVKGYVRDVYSQVYRVNISHGLATHDGIYGTALKWGWGVSTKIEDDRGLMYDDCCSAFLGTCLFTL